MKDLLKLLLAVAVLAAFSVPSSVMAASHDGEPVSFNKNDGKDGEEDGNAGKGQKRGHKGKKHKHAE